MAFRMRSLLLTIFLVCLLPLAGCKTHTEAERAAHAYATHEIAAAPAHGNLPDFSLPPDKLAEAQHLSHIYSVLLLAHTAWHILFPALLLTFGIIGWIRDRANSIGRNFFISTLIFVAALLIIYTALDLPFSIYGHQLSLTYGFSVQRWPSWFVDVAKSLVLTCIGGYLFALLLRWLLRIAPNTWWVYLWLFTIPIALFGAYATPLYLDPLFNKFEPLALHYPQLSAQLTHMGVPPERQFLMKASAKTTLPNAYVTGFGPSKRVVVWDTAIEPNKPVTPQILWTVGHECGHYVLNHVRNGILIGLLFMPLGLWLAHRFLRFTLARYGTRWRVPTQNDLGALAILLFAATLLNILQTPFANDISRHIEHNADIYGEEAIHGLVADPQQAVKLACDQMGTQSLSDPNPNPFVVFWAFTHPPTGYRAAYGAAYNPWAPGMEPKYFPKEK
jgi:Zn-dependent protease with chaperone function